MSTQKIMFLFAAYFAVHKSDSIEQLVCRHDAIPDDVLEFLSEEAVLEIITEKGLWYEGGDIQTLAEATKSNSSLLFVPRRKKNETFVKQTMYFLNIKRYRLLMK